VNRCCYTGRLTKDAETSELNNDKKTKVIYFTIAVQDDYNYKNADFINCQAFGPTVKYLSKHGKKGAYIEFSGKTKTYSKDGVFGSIAVADKVNIIFANSKKDENETDQPQNTSDTETPVF